MVLAGVLCFATPALPVAAEDDLTLGGDPPNLAKPASFVGSTGGTATRAASDAKADAGELVASIGLPAASPPTVSTNGLFGRESAYHQIFVKQVLWPTHDTVDDLAGWGQASNEASSNSGASSDGRLIDTGEEDSLAPVLGESAACDPELHAAAWKAMTDVVRLSGRRIMLYDEGSSGGVCLGIARPGPPPSGAAGFRLPVELDDAHFSGDSGAVLETHLFGSSAGAIRPAESEGAAAASGPAGTVLRAAPARLDEPTWAWIAALAIAVGAVLLWPLYRRLSREHAMEHPTRRAVFDRIVARPGVTAGSISREMGIDRHTALHHLRFLRAFGMIEERRIGARLRYYRNGGSYSEEEKRIHVALAPEKAKKVLWYLLHKPAAPLREIAAVTGLAKPTAKWHLDRLRAFGVLRADGSVAPGAVDVVIRNS